MKKTAALILALLGVTCPPLHAQQVFPPGTFAIDGFPVSCGGYPTVLAPQLQDAGFFDGRALILNPIAIGRLPTPLKLYIYAHECAHGLGIMNEAEADCWAIRTGRDQSWFSPQAFNYLMMFFQNNPGSSRHPPGPARVRNMMACYEG